MAVLPAFRSVPGAPLARFLVVAGYHDAALHVAVKAGLVDDDLLEEAYRTGTDALVLAGIVEAAEVAS